MKIAFDISSISNERKSAHSVRGIGSYTRELFSALKDSESEDEIIGFKTPEEIPSDASLIHFPFFDPFSISLPIIKKAKTVVTIHDFIPLLFPNHFPSGIRGRLNWYVQRSLLATMDGVISVSESTKNDCLRMTGVSEKAIKTIYSAGAEIFSAKISKMELNRIKQAYSLPDEFILYVGDVTWNKNLPRLIKAVLDKKIPLVMVGSALTQEFDHTNPWNNDLIEVSMLTENVPYIQKLGFVSQEDLHGLYQLALTLVMPSLYEGFGFPLLEAMMAKCPVITTRRGAIREVVGDAALFVEPESVESIAGGITSLMGNEQQRSLLVEKGLKQAEKFSWQKTVRETLSFYHDVLSE